MQQRGGTHSRRCNREGEPKDDGERKTKCSRFSRWEMLCTWIAWRIAMPDRQRTSMGDRVELPTGRLHL
jgi:hypothetical protein